MVPVILLNYTHYPKTHNAGQSCFLLVPFPPPSRVPGFQSWPQNGKRETGSGGLSPAEALPQLFVRDVGPGLAARCLVPDAGPSWPPLLGLCPELLAWGVGTLGAPTSAKQAQATMQPSRKTSVTTWRRSGSREHTPSVVHLFSPCLCEETYKAVWLMP